MESTLHNRVLTLLVMVALAGVAGCPSEEDAADGAGANDGGSAAGRGGGERDAHDSAALPLSAKRPRGRRWMNSMMATRTKTLASTAPA